MSNKKELNMNIKVKAASITAVLIAGVIIAVELLRFVVNYLTNDQLSLIISTGFGAFFIYCLYRLVLNELGFKKTLQDMQDSRVDQ